MYTKKKMTIFILLMTFCLVLLTSCGSNNDSKNFNKYEWNDVYTIAYGIKHFTSYGGSPYLEYYSITTSEEREDMKNKYGWKDDVLYKKISVKFEGGTCLIKLITWSEKEEILNYARTEIVYIDYI